MMLSSERRLRLPRLLLRLLTAQRLSGDNGGSATVYWCEARARYADGGAPPTDGECAHHGQLTTAGTSGGCLNTAETTALARVVQHRTRAVGVQPLGPSDDAPLRRRLLRALRDS